MALLYDSIAVLTLVYFFAFIPVVAVGNWIASGNLWFRGYLLLVVYGYFAFCWTRGSTLGMQAWKIVIVAGDGVRRPRAYEVLVRFLAATFVLATGGVGYFAALFDAEGRTWHDRWSGTRLRRRPLNGRARAALELPPTATRSAPER